MVVLAEGHVLGLRVLVDILKLNKSGPEMNLLFYQHNVLCFYYFISN